MAVRHPSFPHVLSSTCARKGEMNIQRSEAPGSADPTGLQTLVWESRVGLKGWGESRVQVREPGVSMDGPAVSTSVTGEHSVQVLRI